MQLVKLSNNIRPLKISAGLLTAASVFVYSDIDSHSGILTVTTNNATTEYIKKNDKDDSGLFMNKFRFQHHLVKWEKKTMFSSSVSKIVDDVDFQSIVAMGQLAVPLILEEIENKPSVLVWALNLIFGEKVTDNPNTTISDACKLWVKQLKK